MPKSGLRSILILVAVHAFGCGPCPIEAPDPALFALPVVDDLDSSAADTWTRHPTHRIDVGSPDSRHRLVNGFSVPEVDPDHGSFAWSLGDSSELAFDVVARGDLPFELHGAPALWRDGPDQEVTLRVNGFRIRHFIMRPGVRVYSAVAPKEALRPGRNILRLDYAWTRSPQDRDPASSDDRPLAAAWYRVDFQSTETEPEPTEASPNGEDLTLRAGVETVFYFDAQLEPGGEVWLTADDLSFDRAGRWLEARWSWDGPGTEEVRNGRLEAATSAGHDGRAAIRLRGLPAGTDRPHAVELTLTVRPATLPGSATLRRPRIRETSESAEETSAVQASAAAPGSSTRSPAPLVLLYVIDTLRADHLGAYGYTRDVSPHLDALAHEGIVFENALSQSSWTRSSMASLVTGVVPTRHGVFDRDDALSLQATTLAEAFRLAGYATAGWTANGNAGDEFGFGQGFDTFDVVKAAAPGDPAAADVVQNLAADFLDALSDTDGGRGFLLLHTMEPHSPYWPEQVPTAQLGVDMPVPTRDETLRRTLEEVAAITSAPMPSSLRMGSTAYLQAMETGALDYDPQLVGRLEELYDAEIRTVDRHFGELMDDLRRRGLYDEALIVVTADHGEEFLDHGGMGHGRTLHGEQLRIPLLIKPPTSWDLPAGRRVSAMVRHVDLWPTLLSAIGAVQPPCHPNLPCEDTSGSAAGPGAGSNIGAGSSLWPLLTTHSARRAHPIRSYAHLDLDGHRAESLRTGRYKLICAGGPGHGEDHAALDPSIRSCELFDLRQDPAETTDLSASLPVLTRSLRHRLRAFHSEASLAEQRVLDEETDAQLRELGYL